jgi:hypothetical protein
MDSLAPRDIFAYTSALAVGWGCAQDTVFCALIHESAQ